ncbi:hypothetical protein LXA43DRAFT_1084445 [Ganoderma leucocontextum]|nr:hypothetical protein LXA43DRAFT_1084445 [Ganoderma leucocontextum]
MPCSSVHTALFCHDILVEILACLSPGSFPWPRSARDTWPPTMEEDLETRKTLQRTLASCAQTCHGLSDLALAELWRVLDHHDFLFRILPWRKDDDGLFHGIIDPDPEIDNLAWSRFRWRSRPDDRSPQHLDPARISAPNGATPSFPSPPPNGNGCGLSISDEKKFLHSFVHLISGSPGDPLDPYMCRLLESVADGVVQHLRTCARLGMLEELDLTKTGTLNSIDDSAVSALSRLPSLRALSTSLPEKGGLLTAPWFTGFTSLRNLSLGFLPIDTLCNILSASSLRASGTLRSIKFESSVHTVTGYPPTPIPASKLQPHLSLIRAALPDELESFSLRFSTRYDSTTNCPPPLSRLLAPFLSFARLKTFEVSFRCGHIGNPRVADKDMRALAAAWPDLEVLYIWIVVAASEPNPSPRPGPTVAGLAELARGCPRLRRVTVPGLNVSALSGKGGALPPDFEGHQGVRFLDVHELVGDDGVVVQDVARALERLFPGLDEYPSVARGLPCQWTESSSWDAVQDAMRESKDRH